MKKYRYEKSGSGSVSQFRKLIAEPEPEAEKMRKRAEPEPHHCHKHLLFIIIYFPMYTNLLSFVFFSSILATTPFCKAKSWWLAHYSINSHH